MKHLDKRCILHLHARLIDLFGGGHGLRDEGLLESALAQPMAEFGGVPLHGGLIEQAAAYAFHLCRNHPFLDGNKRIAAVAMGTFLRINGVDARFDEVSLYAAIMAVAEAALAKAGLTAWLRNELPHPSR